MIVPALIFRIASPLIKLSGLVFLERHYYSNKPRTTQLGRNGEELEDQAIAVILLPPTMSKIISHTRKLMEHFNATFAKYPRLPKYARETFPKLRRNDCV
jgi:hypothetical protein